MKQLTIEDTIKYTMIGNSPALISELLREKGLHSLADSFDETAERVERAEAGANEAEEQSAESVNDLKHAKKEIEKARSYVKKLIVAIGSAKCPDTKVILECLEAIDQQIEYALD